MLSELSEIAGLRQNTVDGDATYEGPDVSDRMKCRNFLCMNGLIKEMDRNGTGRTGRSP